MKDVWLQSLFMFFAGVTCVSALLVLLLPNLLHAAVALFFCLTGIAVLYIFLGADFLAMSQLLVYVGGILILLLFGIFLTAKIYVPQNQFLKEKKHWARGMILSLALFGLLSFLLVKMKWISQPLSYHPTTKTLGNLLLTKYVLPFEFLSILLLFALIGSILLVKKRGEKSR